MEGRIIEVLLYHTYCASYRSVVYHQELENFQRQFFECCIIISALSSGFVYLLQGEAVTAAQHINDSLFLKYSWALYASKIKATWL